MTDLLSHIVVETGDDPQHSIIWLHGLGADGEDFVPIVEQMNLPVAVRYVFPHAPMRPVTINGGYVMRAWYDILVAAPMGGLVAESDALQDEQGIRASQAEVEKLIAQEKRRSIPAGNIFLAGFSQGGAIVLHTGLRHAERLGGMLALSTYLPLAGELAQEASLAAAGLPVFMAHGRDDQVIPYSLGQASARRLADSGYRVEWHEYAMPHSVCMEEIGDMEHWLARRLAGQATSEEASCSTLR
jgi:phospholipase/carboxylesterase